MDKLRASYITIEDINKIERIKNNFLISDEVYSLPEFQEAARKAIHSSLLNYLKEFNYWLHKHADEHLSVAHLLQEKFGIPKGELESEPELQEKVKEILLDKLQKIHVIQYGLDEIDRIKNNFLISDEVYFLPEFQKAARKTMCLILSNYFDRLDHWGQSNADEYLSTAHLLQEKFGIPKGELESEPELQEKVKGIILDKLRASYITIEDINKIERIKNNFLISDEVYSLPEFQEAARKAIHSSLLNYLKEFNYWLHKHADEHLSVAHLLQEKFGIPKGELESEPELQEKVKGIILDKLRASYITIEDINKIERIKNNFLISDEIYFLPEFQEAARKTMHLILYIILKEIDNWGKTYLRDRYLNTLDLLQKKFNIPKGELESEPELQEKAKNIMLKKLQDGHIDLFEDIKTIFLPNDFNIYTQLEFQEAFKLAIIKEIENYLYHNSIEKLNTIIEAKNKFHLEEEFFEEKLRLVVLKNLEIGNINPIYRSRKLNLLPENFFKQPEIIEKIIFVLSIKLIAGEIDYIEKIIQEFGFSNDVYLIIDTQANVSAKFKDPYILIRFIKYLNNSDFYQKFPQTFNHVKESIFANLEKNEDIADYFVENLDRYYQQPWVPENITKAIKHYSVAEKFIHYINENKNIYENEPWVSTTLNDAKNIIKQHENDHKQDNEISWYSDIEGFRESDPYENHPWLFTTQQIKISSTLSGILNGKVNEVQLQNLGINKSEITPLFTKINEKINKAYQNFLEQVHLNPNIKEEDKQNLFNPESSSVKMKPLIENVRSFVARYFVQSINGDVKRLPEIEGLSENLDEIIAEGFRRYIKIYEVDVPLYDKLYEEFDNLRETGRYPLEVFLGRDGIYAWVGRRAQDVSRRRKIGLAGRKKLKEMGEVIEIHPQYIVYPRYFRDNINYEVKRQFLEQEGINPDADPLFYDTGYVGTIPEQIMKIMGFEQEDIEQRIRLLSAPNENRRVKGIAQNARSEIIEYIEHNAKPEETAEGLILDEKTGKIHYIAKPTSPEEQFYFMMIKQAIERHYWLQEKLYHQPSGNIDIHSEHYNIRIRQDYAKLLPQEFIEDPKKFLTKQVELLKGSKDEGAYTDEEVILFKLTDGTEIVAKYIELRKAKEAQKEFSILIAAKKAGLPTAEPVGFLSSKGDSDNYLLTKKIKGVSGRNFEREFIKAGKYTADQIKTIMQQVAEKNQEMVELFKTTLKIDEHWRIKDTIIEFNEETGEVESVVPISWERV